MIGFWTVVLALAFALGSFISSASCFLLGIYAGRRTSRAKPVIETWTEKRKGA